MPSVLHACSAGFSIKIIQAACILGCGDLRLLCNVESDRQVDRTIIASADIEQVSGTLVGGRCAVLCWQLPASGAS